MLLAAQPITNPALDPAIRDKTGLAFFQKLLPNLVTLTLIIGSVIFLFIIIMGAIQWISSGGDKQGLESARSKISNALIGLVILFSIFAVIKVAESFFGVSILTLDIGSLFIK